MPQLEIITVSNASDLDAFINVPWKIYAGDDTWVPPLKKQVHRLLGPRKASLLEVFGTSSLFGSARL